jgi:alpha-L-rhamnosidase
MWSSNRVLSSQQLHIPYGGKPLRSFTRYYWRVQAYDKNGHASSWSPIAWFETAMLNENDWKGKWIGDGSEHPERTEDHYREDRMPLFRKDFKTGAATVTGARLYISGLGYYEAYINGKKVGDHVLDPGWTTYKKQVQYVVHDITPLYDKRK